MKFGSTLLTALLLVYAVIFVIHGEPTLFNLQLHVLQRGSILERFLILFFTPLLSLNNILWSLDPYFFHINRSARITFGTGLPRAGTTNWHSSVSPQGSFVEDIMCPSLIMKHTACRILGPMARFGHIIFNIDERPNAKFEEESAYLMFKGKGHFILHLFPSVFEADEIWTQTQNVTESDIDFLMEAVHRTATFHGAERYIGKDFTVQMFHEHIWERHPDVRFVVLHRPLEKVLPSLAQLIGKLRGLSEMTPDFQKTLDMVHFPNIYLSFHFANVLLTLANEFPNRVFNLPSEVWFNIAQYSDASNALSSFLGVDRVEPIPRQESHSKNDVWHFVNETSYYGMPGYLDFDIQSFHSKIRGPSVPYNSVALEK